MERLIAGLLEGHWQRRGGQGNRRTRAWHPAADQFDESRVWDVSVGSQRIKGQLLSRLGKRAVANTRGQACSPISHLDVDHVVAPVKLARLWRSSFQPQCHGAPSQ